MATGIDWNSIYEEVARQLLAGEQLDSDALYNATIEQFSKALDQGLKQAPSEDDKAKLAQALKSNLEQFGLAKTLTQLNHYADALLDDNGNMRSYDTLKKLIADQGEVFNNAYAKTECNLIKQSTIMAAKWETLDSEYLEFTTVGDDRVRPEHAIFDKFTAPKSDPIWKKLYTPLSWNCRCTIIPGIAKNESKEYDSKWANQMVTPQVKGTIFDNNVGISKEIFTKAHPYFEAIVSKIISNNTNQEAKDSSSGRYDNITFKPVKGIKNGGKLEIFTTGKQNSQEAVQNETACKILANNGGHYRLLPVIEDGNKNPDAFNLKTGNYVDIKSPITLNGKNITQSALKEASKQETQEVVIHLTNKPSSYREMYLGVKTTLKNNRAKDVKTLTVIFPDKNVKNYDLVKLRNKLNNKRAK
ncbi:phage minor head protein [Flavobacterium sp.]|uniref:phage minor head protein n=1 Tax=Flavobacterium sp. TaxID=239 RepID=UPI0025DFCDB5|nr:phage minor head protein [Flavobacterium sp.]